MQKSYKKDIGNFGLEALFSIPKNVNATGEWRVERPVIDYKKCKNCLVCFMYCPEGAIEIKNGKVKINYKYCKGCGVCVNECPLKAIHFESEKEKVKK
ncbi:MAG: 4Fe-4S dicluster domain-containing protein [Candidatus Micrarchaeales archaeon]